MKKFLAILLLLLAGPAFADLLTQGLGGIGSLIDTLNPLAKGTNITLSSGNLVATDNQVIRIAIDFGAQRIWLWGPYNGTDGLGQWNKSGTADPGTGTGGYTYAATGALFPAAGLCGNASVTENGTVNFGGSAFAFAVPSGFSSWNALAGTTTWNPSDKASGVTLSNGNLTASIAISASCWLNVRATTSLSSGKAYFEIYYTPIGSAGYVMSGLANSSASLTTNLGANTNSLSWQADGELYEVNGCTSGSCSSDGYTWSAPVIHEWKSVLSTLSYTTGKKYFEVSANSVSSAGAFIIGVCDSSQQLQTVSTTLGYIGASQHGYGYNAADGGVYHNASTGTTLATYTTGAVVGVAVDLTNNKLWYTLNGSTWNNDIIANQNPATNTGGASLDRTGTGLVGAVYAGVSQGRENGLDVGTVNFGGTAFTYTVPSGFSAW